MVLGFKERFVGKIIEGSKIHTIRRDKNKKWQKKVKIHFATGVRTPFYNQFKFGECKFNQSVHLIPEKREIWLGLNGGIHLLNKKHNAMFAKNDGFDTEDEFWEWFNEEYHGVVIHWTNFVYA